MLLFPRVSVVSRVLQAKFNLLFRGTARLPNLFPEAVVCDQGLLLALHRQGYSQILSEWCQFFRVEEAFAAADMAEVRGVLAAFRQSQIKALWTQFSLMPSTAFAATVFMYRSVLEASKFGLLGARAAILVILGLLSLSYDRSRFCHCGEKFSFQHFVACPLLGPNRTPTLHLAVERKDWHSVALVLLSRF
jgi:hypothetical protein